MKKPRTPHATIIRPNWHKRYSINVIPLDQYPDSESRGSLFLLRHEFPHRGYPLKVIWVNRHPDYPQHRHTFWELVLVVSGTAMHHIGRASYPIQAGDFFVLNDSDIHSYSDTNNLCLYNILFDFKKLRLSSWEIKTTRGFQKLFHTQAIVTPAQASQSHFHLTEGVSRNCVALIEEMSKNLQDHRPGSQMLLEGHFRHLVVLLSRSYDDSLRIHDEARSRMVSAIAILEQKYTQAIDFNELAQSHSVSVRTFYRLFKRATGHPPQTYLIQLRLKRACELLRNTELPVTQIAYESGFMDSNYFTREFRRILGETPSAYRKRWAN